MSLSDLLDLAALMLVGVVLVVITVRSWRRPAILAVRWLVEVSVRWLWVPRRLLALGLLLLALTALHPPWYARVSAGARVPCDSGPLWSKPASCGGRQSWSEMAQVDIGRLLLEWAVLAGITGGLALLAATKKA